jgi:hypothetical protein
MREKQAERISCCADVFFKIFTAFVEQYAAGVLGDASNGMQHMI